MFIYWLIVLVLFAVAYWYLSMPRNLPPGLLGLPFIGSVLDLWDADTQHLTLQRYARKYGRVYSFYIINRLFIVLADFEAIQEVFVKQGYLFSGIVNTHLSPTLGVTTMVGDRWKYFRRFEQSFLTDVTLRRPIMDGLLRDEANNLVKQMINQNGKPFDSMRMIARSVIDVLFKLTFGRPCTNEDIIDGLLVDVDQEAGIVASIFSPILVPTALTRFGNLIPWVRKERREHDEFATLLEQELLETKSTFDATLEPTNYVHAFMKAAMQQSESENYLNETTLFLTSCLDFVLIPAEALIGIIHHSLKYLMIHPDIQQRLADETRNILDPGASIVYSDRAKLPFLEATILEGMRMSDLAPLGVPHQALAPTKLFGYDVPEGTAVVAMLTNVLNDPEHYTNPRSFDPSRFLDEDGRVKRDPKLIPFQTGKRMCLGDNVSKMMFFVFIGTICSRLKLECPPGQPKPNMEPRVIGLMAGSTTIARTYEMCVKVRQD